MKPFQTRHITHFLFRMALSVLLIGPAVRGPSQDPPPDPNQPPAAQPTPAPGQPGAAPTPVVRTSMEEIIPMNEDPNDPTASPEERLRRQKVIIMKRIEARQKILEEAQKRAEEAAAANPGVPTPTPLPNGMPVVPTPKPEPAKPAAAVNMFLSPATITVRTGERFNTQCDLLNPDHLRIDGIEIALSYPANCIRLVSIHQDKIKPTIAGEPTCMIDEERGEIFYKIRLARQVNAINVPTVTFQWEATHASDAAEISLTTGERVSQVTGNGKVLSRGMAGPGSAVLGAFLRIDAPQGATPSGGRYLDLGNATIRSAGFRDQSKLQPPRLWIHQPESGPLAPGEWHVIDIGVENPDRVVFDEIRLAAAFNPEDIEIRDADQGNWISDGVNLLDGPFRKEWDWTRHYKNEVNVERGFFHYRMGARDLREQPSGTVARIFVRIKRPTYGPLFTWLWGDPKNPDSPTTGVFLFTVNLYDKLLAGGGDGEEFKPADAGWPLRDAVPGVEKADPELYRSKGPDHAETKEISAN